MVKKLFSQLERLAFRLQTEKLKKTYPTLSGIKMSSGLLWQHPDQKRQKILTEYKKRLALDIIELYT